MLHFSIIILVSLCGNSFAYYVNNSVKAKSYNNRQRFLVIHYTAIDLENSVKILTGDKVSSHYLVPDGKLADEGIIYQFVDENLRAFTQGISYWRGWTNLNDNGISIEIVNLGYEHINKTIKWFPFSNSQIQLVTSLSKDIVKRYSLEPKNVIGHSDCAPGRKQDPGPLFPWEQLYKDGIGAWPEKNDVLHFQQHYSNTNLKLEEVHLELQTYGYFINKDAETTRNAIISFQMHFRPAKYDGIMDTETFAILKALNKKYR
ncbi:N-acetylmuramoyl-L-alanine amidase AmiD [Hydra vulgaris]|uniref:N-acetylmuramoyl-L-alanine amidase n=1 Tax=Hydra vulgaris TaxID=6087 RepID=A0ABM4D0I5_HYDVU